MTIVDISLNVGKSHVVRIGKFHARKVIYEYTGQSYILEEITNIRRHRRRTHRGNGSFVTVLLKIPGQTYLYAPVLFGQ